MRKLPPNPERMNGKRASWARTALIAFGKKTGQKITRVTENSDETDMVPDLLANLMHYCDRRGFDFGAALARAGRHYIEETARRGTQVKRIHIALVGVK